MAYAALFAQRRLCGQIGCALMLLLLAALIDGMVAGGLKDPNRLDVLPGQTVSLSEQLPRGAEKLNDIVLRPSDPRIALHLKETYSGFWMGGAIWRAEAMLPQDLPVGEYKVAALYAANGTAPSPPQSFTLRVHPDQRAIQAASGSLTTRTLGLSPYLFALCLLGLAILPMAASFVLTRRIAQALRAAGMAEVFRAMAPRRDPQVAPGEASDEDESTDEDLGQRIFFTPGPGHALAPGTLVDVLDERAKIVLGQAQVIDISNENVTASMQDGVQVRPGSLIRRSARA